MKFGTSGLRGLSVDLVGPSSKRYAEAFGQYLLETGRAKVGDDILIGQDFRPSSHTIATNCAVALSAIGFKVVNCGTLPTPALALYGMKRGVASLMITGSHIPADRNGIKFYRPDGEIDKQDETAIIRAVEGISEVGNETDALQRTAAADCDAEFLARNKALLTPNALSGLKIGVYQHSTVARDMMMEVLSHYGAAVIALGRSETFIPVDTEAVSPDTITALQAWAAEHELDSIVSADGDGDRPLVTDETGVPLRGDLLGLVAANFLDATTVVTPVTSNSGIEAVGTYRVIRTKVGSPFVIAGMNEARAAGENRILGFEANGGVLVGSDFTINGTLFTSLPTRDSFLPILAVLARAAMQKQSLSVIASSYKLPVAAADRLENFPLETSAALMAHLHQSSENLSAFLMSVGTIAGTSDVDGLRVTLGNGRIIHFRPSGNAPEMRCYVEAETEIAANALLQTGLALIRDWASKRG